MALLLKTLGGLTALILVVITMLGSIITLGGVLLSVIKIFIVVLFIAIILAILFAMLRDRSRQRDEAPDF